MKTDFKTNAYIADLETANKRLKFENDELSVEINNLKNAYRRIQAEVDMGNKTIDSTLKYLEFLREGHKDGEKCGEAGK